MFYVQLSVGAVLVVVSLSSAPQFCYFIVLCSVLYTLLTIIFQSTLTDSDLYN